MFHWLDSNRNNKIGKFANQLLPIITCLTLLGLFMLISFVFIEYLINPFSKDKILYEFHLKDVVAGFLIYFLTAIDYAIIIGRMQTVNNGAKARFVMNIFTCVGCFVGVSLVLFLWGYLKEVDFLIIPLLVFAASVMIKLAYEGVDYFENGSAFPKFLTDFLILILRSLYYVARVLTYWMPEMNTPNVKKMSLTSLAKWSFFLPFIIGVDELIGYMGAMTIYNVFGLLLGIYIADIFIDILIFVSPGLTTKIVENKTLAIFGSVAFLYLGYKSLNEAIHILNESYSISGNSLIILFLIFFFIVYIFDKFIMKIKHKDLDLDELE